MLLKASLFFLQLKNLLSTGLPPSKEVFSKLSLVSATSPYEFFLFIKDSYLEYSLRG
jgi:hypothetical protein